LSYEALFRRAESQPFQVTSALSGRPFIRRKPMARAERWIGRGDDEFDAQ
jgi:hypothetical protein